LKLTRMKPILWDMAGNIEDFRLKIEHSRKKAQNTQKNKNDPLVKSRHPGESRGPVTRPSLLYIKTPFNGRGLYVM